MADVKGKEEALQENIVLKDYAIQLIKDLDAEYTFFKENFERKINKRKEEFKILEEKPISNIPSKGVK